jgi:hypothetical protein
LLSVACGSQLRKVSDINTALYPYSPAIIRAIFIVHIRHRDYGGILPKVNSSHFITAQRCLLRRKATMRVATKITLATTVTRAAVAAARRRRWGGATLAGLAAIAAAAVRRLAAQAADNERHRSMLRDDEVDNATHLVW